MSAGCINWQLFAGNFATTALKDEVRCGFTAWWRRGSHTKDFGRTTQAKFTQIQGVNTALFETQSRIMLFKLLSKTCLFLRNFCVVDFICRASDRRQNI